MGELTQRFPIDGYVIVDDLLNVDEIERIESDLEFATAESAGDRRFLDREWCRLVAHVIRHRLLKLRLLGLPTQPVLCTYFSKDGKSNWGVGLHRDMHVPLRARIEHKTWGNWSEKQQIPHAQAPRSFLSNMLAVRVHIDACNSQDGVLSVVPGSHATADVVTERVDCGGRRGSAVIMSPLLLHCSSKSESGRPRRVLHFLYGPKGLPDGAEWYYSA